MPYPAVASPPRPNPFWRFRLFGGLNAQRRGGPRALTIERFKAQKNQSLLAYLATYPRPHHREILLEVFWSGVNPDPARNGLRVALANLRTLLEYGEIPKQGVLHASRLQVGLVPGSFETDAEEFWDHLESARQTIQRQEQIDSLQRAVALYVGPFMMGSYEPWITPEASRAEEAYDRSLRRLIYLQEESGNFIAARDSAFQGAVIDPLREDLQRDLLRLCPIGEEPQTLKRFDQWRSQMRRAGETPSGLIETLASKLRSHANLKQTAPAEPSEELLNGRDSSKSGSLTPMINRPGVINPPTLPVSWTSFFGRDEELGVVEALLEDPATRLVNLTGVGGSGKTRLALEVSRRLLARGGSDSPCVIAFVPLVEVTEGAGIPAAVLEAMGEPPGNPSLETILAALQERYGKSRGLIILDNFEHLQKEALPFVKNLLEKSPQVTCLITSRHRLNFSGERVVSVDSLPVPSMEGAMTENATDFASVRLFLNRARLARPDLPLTASNVAAAARLCVRLNGLPLAIELAAARTALFSLSEILAELDKERAVTPHSDASVSPIDWENRDSTVAERHRSLRAALAWSVAQLPPATSRFWSKLWVFRDGWNLEDAAAICEEPSAAALMLGLRDASLITLETNRKFLESPRGFLLEPLREFAGEKVSPLDRQHLQQRHADRFLALAENATPYLSGPESAPWLRRMEAERQNFRRALEWFLQTNEEKALRLVSSLWWVWEMRGRSSEARGWLDQALEAADIFLSDEIESPHLLTTAEQEFLKHKARALNGAGKLSNLEADFAASARHLERALKLFRMLEDKSGQADTLYSLGFMKLRSGNLKEARELCTTSVAMTRELGDNGALSDALYNLSMVALFEGRFQEVRVLNTERLAVHRASGYKRGMAVSLENIGLANLLGGDLLAADTYLEESRAIFEKLEEWTSVARVLWGKGHIARGMGAHENARANFVKALQLARETRYSWALPYLLEALALIGITEKDFPRAIRLLGSAAHLRATHSEPLPTPLFQAEQDEAKRFLRREVGEGVFEAYWTFGSFTPLPEILTYALKERPEVSRELTAAIL